MMRSLCFLAGIAGVWSMGRNTLSTDDKRTLRDTFDEYRAAFACTYRSVASRKFAWNEDLADAARDEASACDDTDGDRTSANRDAIARETDDEENVYELTNRIWEWKSAGDEHWNTTSRVCDDGYSRQCRRHRQVVSQDVSEFGCAYRRCEASDYGLDNSEYAGGVYRFICYFDTDPSDSRDVTRDSADYPYGSWCENTWMTSVDSAMCLCDRPAYSSTENWEDTTTTTGPRMSSTATKSTETVPSDVEPSSTETKSTEYKSTETKSTEIESTETKSSEVESTETKSTEVESTEAKSTEVESTEAKEEDRDIYDEDDREDEVDEEEKRSNRVHLRFELRVAESLDSRSDNYGAFKEGVYQALQDESVSVALERVDIERYWGACGYELDDSGCFACERCTSNFAYCKEYLDGSETGDDDDDDDDMMETTEECDDTFRYLFRFDVRVSFDDSDEVEDALRKIEANQDELERQVEEAMLDASRSNDRPDGFVAVRVSAMSVDGEKEKGSQRDGALTFNVKPLFVLLTFVLSLFLF